jgi:hypothetical protein
MKRSDVDERQILDRINCGKGQVEISKELNIGIKPIHRISKCHNLYDLLKQNNQKHKTKASKLLASERQKITTDRIHDKFGGIIRSMIFDKLFTTYDIRKHINIPQKRCNQYLIYHGLYDECVKNGKTKISNLARINGKLSSNTLSGVELKPITDSIRNRFEELKGEFIYKQKVYDALYEEFGFGERKSKQLCERFGYPINNPQTGKLNPMYGKSPSKKSGIGTKCHLYHDGCLIFCRSLLELKIYLYLIDNGVEFQLSKHRIQYKLNGVDRTYCPDIVMNDVEICEIKPSNLVKLDINQIKFKSLVEYCNCFNLKCKYLTELDFDLKKYSNIDYILMLIDNGKIRIDNSNLEKLKRNII